MFVALPMLLALISPTISLTSHKLCKSEDAAKEGARPCDIVVKFVSYRKRAQFYKASVDMKNKGYKGLHINRHLTKVRAKLL